MIKETDFEQKNQEPLKNENISLISVITGMNGK